MSINVGNKRSESASFMVVTDDRGRLKLMSEDGEVRGAFGIGATNSVGSKSVTTDKGGQITELRDTVGGTFGADDAIALFERLTFSDGRGDVEGVEGVELISLTHDSYTVAIDNGHAVDTLTITGFGDILAGLDTGADVGDGRSRFSIVDDNTPTIIGTGDDIRDLVGGFARGEQDEAAILAAALDQGDDRVELLGLEADGFAVQIVSDSNGTTDTLIFKTEDTAAAIASLESGVVNPGNANSQFVILEEGDTGTVGIGGGRLNVTDTLDGSDDVGGVLSVEDAILLAETADERPNVTAIDQGDSVRVEFPGNGGSTEILIVPDELMIDVA